MSRRVISTALPLDRCVSQWGAASRIVYFKQGTITLNAVASNTDAIAVTDPNNAILFAFGHSYNAAAVDESAIFCRLALTSATVVTASRTTADANICVVSYLVIEFAPGVIRSIQRNTVAGGSTTAITAVDLNKTTLVPLGMTINADSADLRCVGYISLTNSTTVTGTYVAGAATPTMGFQAVEFY